MKSLVVLGKGIIANAVRLALPADLDQARWCEIGAKLGKLERAGGWWIGDWWAFGEHRYGRAGKSSSTQAGRDRRIRLAPTRPRYAGHSNFPAGGKF